MSGLRWPTFSGPAPEGTNALGDVLEKMIQREKTKADAEYRALQLHKAAAAKYQKDLDRQSMAAVDAMVNSR